MRKTRYIAAIVATSVGLALAGQATAGSTWHFYDGGIGDDVYQGSILYASRAQARATAALCARVGLRRCLLALSGGDTNLVTDCAGQGVTLRSFVRQLRRAHGTVAIYSEQGGYPWRCRIRPHAPSQDAASR